MEEPNANTKQKNPYKIAAIILGCIVILLGTINVWLVVDKLDNSGSGNEVTGNETILDGTEINDSPKADTVQLLASIKNAISKAELEPGLQWNLAESDDGGIYYDVAGTGTAFFIQGHLLEVMVEETEDLLGETDNLYGTESSDRHKKEMTAAAETRLVEAGFSDIGEFEHRENFMYYADGSGEIVCAVGIEEGSGSYIGSIACSNLNDISESDKALATELAEAFRKNVGEYPDIANVSDAKIIDSKYKPYQYIEGANVGGGMSRFYRKNPESDWVFLSNSQALLFCSDYNDDAARAYAGEACFKNKNYDEGVVAPKS